MPEEPAGKAETADRVVEDVQTRFLYPFFFHILAGAKLHEAALALRGATLAGRAELWQWAEPLRLYKDDLFHHVQEYLFPDVDDQKGADRSGCRFLRIPVNAPDPQKGPKATKPHIPSWFQNTVVQLKKGVELPIHLLADVAIELVLSPQGVGVLSICLTPGRKVSQAEAIRFNYQLANLQSWSAPKLHNCDPRDNPEVFARMPEKNKAALPPYIAGDAPLGDRLARAGGTFVLREMLVELLRPLEKFGFNLQLNQPSMSVYTLATFDAAVDFGSEPSRDELSRFLSTLAQVEEVEHPGVPVGTLGTTGIVSNRKHWIAVGQMGAAHLLAEQPGRPGHDEDKYPFNRQERVRVKYFIPFLIALLQRLTLNRSTFEMETTARDGASTDAKARQHGYVLQFGGDGFFTQLHGRHALHEFYRVAQQGLDVPAAWASHSAQRQEQIAFDISQSLRSTNRMSGQVYTVAQSMEHSLQIVARVQSMVEWIEAFIVSVYVAHLWHMISENNKPLQDWVKEHVPIEEHWLVHGGVFVLAAIALTVMLAILRPWHHTDDSGEPARVKH